MAFWNDMRNNRVNALNDYLRKQEFRKELRARGFEPESESEEDNPFAMYKYSEEDLKMDKNIDNTGPNSDFNSQIENLESTLQMTEINKENEQSKKKLNVIDPGPSTSKDSMPWIDDVPQAKSTFSQKVKSVGRAKSAKGKVQKKTVRKNKISSLSVSEKLFKDPFSNQTLETQETSINNSSNDLSNQPNETECNAEEQMDIDTMLVEENDRLLAEELDIEIPTVSEKERRKQERREAKMREISERLKAYNEAPSQPPNS